MKIKIEDAKPGIYVIKNLINGKIYVGKSKNIYKRLHQHKYDIKIDNRNYNENPHLLNSVKKYGIDNFDYYVVEYIDESLDAESIELMLSERELFWMKDLDCLNKEKGYNLRYDSEGKCYVSDETREKISNRLKKEWDNGVRSGHSDKLKDYWSNNEDRKKQQSKIMSKNKTKYKYIIYNPDGELITKTGNYALLKELGLQYAATAFSKKKTDEYVCKKHKVIRKLINEEIVQN